MNNEHRQLITFESWWRTIGSGITPIEGHDHEEHAERIARITWGAALGLEKHETQKQMSTESNKGPSGEDPNKKEQPKIYLDPDYQVPLPDMIDGHEIDKERFRFSNQDTWPEGLRTAEGRKIVFRELAKLRVKKLRSGKEGQGVVDELTKHAGGERPSGDVPNKTPTEFASKTRPTPTATNDSSTPTSPRDVSAFPQTVEIFDGIEGRTAQVGGMTLRDYFAGQALAGLMVSAESSARGSDKEEADWCYAMADAMLAAREQS